MGILLDSLIGFLTGLWWASATGVMIIVSLGTLGGLNQTDDKNQTIIALLITPVVIFLDFVVFSKSWQYFTGYFTHLTGA